MTWLATICSTRCLCSASLGRRRRLRLGEAELLQRRHGAVLHEGLGGIEPAAPQRRLAQARIELRILIEGQPVGDLCGDAARLQHEALALDDLLVGGHLLQDTRQPGDVRHLDADQHLGLRPVARGEHEADRHRQQPACRHRAGDQGAAPPELAEHVHSVAALGQHLERLG
ncbi:MAG TPA: hypothetical protein VIR38_06100, partial [Thalassobaculum sp.]